MGSFMRNQPVFVRVYLPSFTETVPAVREASSSTFAPYREIPAYSAASSSVCPPGEDRNEKIPSFAITLATWKTMAPAAMTCASR